MKTQYGEEAYITGYFGTRTGRFLDIGANLQFSNTVQLAATGWSGVCVEPGPKAAQALRDYYAARPDIQIVEAAITQHTGQVTFYESIHGGVYSSTEQAHKLKIETQSEGVVTFEPITVAGVIFRDLLTAHPGPYQFVNIDVEGKNQSVLGWLLDEFTKAPQCYNLHMICVEVAEPDSLAMIAGLLDKFGLFRHRMIGGNLLATIGEPAGVHL